MCDDVRRSSLALGELQVPCYDGIGHAAILVSLVGAAALGPGVCVNDVVLPLLAAVEAEVRIVQRLL